MKLKIKHKKNPSLGVVGTKREADKYPRSISRNALDTLIAGRGPGPLKKGQNLDDGNLN